MVLSRSKVVLAVMFVVLGVVAVGGALVNHNRTKGQQTESEQVEEKPADEKLDLSEEGRERELSRLQGTWSLMMHLWKGHDLDHGPLVVEAGIWRGDRSRPKSAAAETPDRHAPGTGRSLPGWSANDVGSLAELGSRHQCGRDASPDATGLVGRPGRPADPRGGSPPRASCQPALRRGSRGSRRTAR
jgi:hypothetical protein